MELKELEIQAQELRKQTDSFRTDRAALARKIQEGQEQIKMVRAEYDNLINRGERVKSDKCLDQIKNLHSALEQNKAKMSKGSDADQVSAIEEALRQLQTQAGARKQQLDKKTKDMDHEFRDIMALQNTMNQNLQELQKLTKT